VGYRVPLYVSLAVFAISANAVPPLISTMSLELAVPARTLGTGIAVQYLSFAAMSWLGGAFAERRRIAARSMVLAAVETFASIGLTAGNGGGSSKPLCFSQAIYSSGAILAPMVAGFCIVLGGGWKVTFAIFGAVASAVTIAIAFSGRFQRAGTEVSASEGGMHAEDAGPSAGAKRERPSAVWLHRALMFAYTIGEGLCVSWMPFMLETLRGMEAAAAAEAAALFWAGMVAGRMAIVFLPDRLTLRPALVLSSSLASLAAAILVAVPALSLPAFVLLGVAMGPIWPVVVGVAASELRAQSQLSSVIAVGGLGAAMGPFIGSLFLKEGLSRYYFSALAAMFLCVVAIMVAGAVRKGRVRTC